MHFSDVINFPVAGQCCYQVMCSIPYICKRNASFCQIGRRRPPLCLQIQEELLPQDAQMKLLPYKPSVFRMTRFQCNNWGSCTIIYTKLFIQQGKGWLTKRTFHQAKAGEVISFSTRFPVTQHQLASISTTETIIFRFLLPFIFRSASPCSLFGLFAFFFWGISGRILKERDINV